jgi:hypothetical protein
VILSTPHALESWQEGQQWVPIPMFFIGFVMEISPFACLLG